MIALSDDIMMIVPVLLLGCVSDPPTSGIFKSQKAKSRYNYSLFLSMIWVNFEHTKCALKYTPILNSKCQILSCKCRI